MAPYERKKTWKTKRVFFLTPQVLSNDLSRQACPAEDIKCLVVDEAHKALGNHAYCEVRTKCFEKIDPQMAMADNCLQRHSNLILGKGFLRPRGLL